MRYYFSLGSNLGDRESNIQEAIAFLEGTGRLISKSSIYKTAPVDMPEETEDFLNLALAVDSGLSPREMLKKIQRFEQKMGRNETNSGYESRTIDIDILMANDIILDEKNLVIPHPRMIRRAFVLVPLCEIAPDLIHPILKRTMLKILPELNSNETVRKYGSQRLVKKFS